MKKQKTVLIVVLIVAIVAVGVGLALGLSGKNTEDKESTVVNLTAMEDVTYIQYKNKEGTVTLVKTDGAWTCEENAELDLTRGYVYEKAAELATIEGTLVEDAVKSDCGLEGDTYSLFIKDSDNEVKLVLGVNSEGHCYAMIEGENEIYEVDKTIVEILELSAESYVAPVEDMHAIILDSPDETDTDDDAELDEETIDDEMIGDEIIEEEPTEDIE